MVHSLRGEKGDQVKKLALLCVAALMLAATVLAPVAQAQEPVEVKANVQSVTVRPDPPEHFFRVTGTIQCTEGQHYILQVGVVEAEQQPSAKKFKKNKDIIRAIIIGRSGTCAGTTEPQSVTAEVGFTDVTKQSKLWAVAFGQVCFTSQDGQFTCTQDLAVERLKIG
jgi:hypothetical protein